MFIRARRTSLINRWQINRRECHTSNNSWQQQELWGVSTPPIQWSHAHSRRARALPLSASWRGANESVLSELNDNGEAERSAQWLTATKFHEVFPSLGKSSFCQRISGVYCQTLTQTFIDISGHDPEVVAGFGRAGTQVERRDRARVGSELDLSKSPSSSLTTSLSFFPLVC